jgi:hypothetical protein
MLLTIQRGVAVFDFRKNHHHDGVRIASVSSCVDASYFRTQKSVSNLSDLRFGAINSLQCVVMIPVRYQKCKEPVLFASLLLNVEETSLVALRSRL